MKLVTKITVALAMATLGMLIISLSSYMGFTKIDKELTQIADYQVSLNNQVVTLQKNILEEKTHIFELLYESTKNSKTRFSYLKDEVRDISISTKKSIKSAEILVKEALANNNQLKIQKNYKIFLDELIKLKKVHTIFYDEFSSLNINNIALKEISLLEKMDFMTKDIERLNIQVDKFLNTTVNQAEINEENALFRMGIITFISLFLSIVTSISLMRLVRHKFNDFNHGFNIFFEFLNRKRDDVKLLDESSKDEFGLMSKTINDNIKNTKNLIEEDRKVIDETLKVLTEFEQGDLYQRVKIQSTNPALKELTRLLNQMAEHLEHNIEVVIDVLDEYSNHNYINRVDNSGLKFHLLKLANGINAIGDATTQMLQKGKVTGLTLDLTSDILLENVDILNKNSNEAAAALEETAAALEQMTGTINQNSENIKQMVSNANELTKSSNIGKQLAEKTTQSMVDIDEQVNAINDAIVVIDQIAFQTNILSLNAAVEAATAGEAGKGFAVVAQEVRNLANRSAEAAKEIKELVENATNKANEGKDISQEMIEGYSNLNENISKTLDLIKGVERASNEQQSGIKQINDAVTNLDQETQENVMIFTKTKEVAVQTDVMAKESVSDIDSKEFENKDSLEARDLNQIKSSYSNENSWEKF